MRYSTLGPWTTLLLNVLARRPSLINHFEIQQAAFINVPSNRRSVHSFFNPLNATPEYIRGRKMSPYEFIHFYITCHLVGLHL